MGYGTAAVGDTVNPQLEDFVELRAETRLSPIRGQDALETAGETSALQFGVGHEAQKPRTQSPSAQSPEPQLTARLAGTRDSAAAVEAGRWDQFESVGRR